MNHIQSLTEPGISWCGQQLSDIVFNFKTVDQAAVNGLFPDGRTACKDCINLCVQSLLNNIEADND
jgi:hypothetical protein